MIEPHRTESIVRQRYAAGAKERADKLCCPVEYDSAYLKAIPQEVIERDYGCGDPSRYLREGEVVVDLGSGTGKICALVLLHLVCAVSVNVYREALHNGRRLASFTQTGFYFLLMKLTTHVARAETTQVVREAVA
jgi:hypothetical protein